jgi:hypothetical protein
MDMQPTTAIGTRGSSVKPGEVDSLSIQRADNGFTVSIQTKQKPLKKGENRDWDAGRENEVYTSVESLCARIRTAFAGVKLEKSA